MSFKSHSRFGKLLSLLSLLLAVSTFVTPAHADDYSYVRGRYDKYLVGGTNSDPDVVSAVQATCENIVLAPTTGLANIGHFSAVSGFPGYIFPAYQTNNEGNILGTYADLKIMALAYATQGDSNCFQNVTLKNDVLFGMDWVAANWYTTTGANPNDFNLKVGIPLMIIPVMAVMSSELTSSEFSAWSQSIDHYVGNGPCCDSASANVSWYGFIKFMEGILTKNDTLIDTGLTAIDDAMTKHYTTVTGFNQTGFYPDGSFVQHIGVPYNGGYGGTVWSFSAETINLLQGARAAWLAKITQPNLIYQWIFTAYRPLIFQGGMMSMVQGRYLSRPAVTEHTQVAGYVSYMLDIAQIAPTTSIGAGFPANTKLAIQQFIQQIINVDQTGENYLGTQPYYMNLYKQQIAANITAAPQLTGHFTFSNMDRVTHLRNGYALGLSMSSKRISNYESLNVENLHGWHIGDGMTYLYTGYQNQFTGDHSFWPTINGYRMPGTTVIQNTTEANSIASTESWVGGTTLPAGYGTAGMSLHVSDLTAKKSWFMFDTEIVCLGAGINANDTAGIITVVENRMLNINGTNPFYADGIVQPAAIPTTQNPVGDGLTSWVWLAGNAGGQNIGYYFPTPTRLYSIREHRTGNWSDIGMGVGSSGISDAQAANYLSFWIGHGTTPANDTYAYVLLPNLTMNGVSNYAASPQVKILSNTATLQAVQQTSLNMIGANFWTAGQVDLPGNAAFITSNNPSSVMMSQNADHTVDISVSDPTQENTGTVKVVLKLNGTTANIVLDPTVHVHSLVPIELWVNVNGQSGQTSHAKITLQ